MYIAAEASNYSLINVVFYIHGSVHRESNWIIVQQDATVFCLLHTYL